MQLIIKIWVTLNKRNRKRERERENKANVYVNATIFMQIEFYELPKNCFIFPDKLEYYVFLTSYKLHCTWSFRSVNNLASNVLTDELSFPDRVSPVSRYRLQHHGSKQEKIMIENNFWLYFLLFETVKAFPFSCGCSCMFAHSQTYILFSSTGRTLFIWKPLSETRCKNYVPRTTCSLVSVIYQFLYIVTMPSVVSSQITEAVCITIPEVNLRRQGTLANSKQRSQNKLFKH
jgi:hypothetical protein